MRNASNYLELTVCYHMKLACFQHYIAFHEIGYCAASTTYLANI